MHTTRFPRTFPSVSVATRYSPRDERASENQSEKKFKIKIFLNKRFFSPSKPNGQPSHDDHLSRPSSKRFAIRVKLVSIGSRKSVAQATTETSAFVAGPPFDVANSPFFVRAVHHRNEMMTTAKMARCCAAAVVLALCAAHAATAYPTSVRR